MPFPFSSMFMPIGPTNLDVFTSSGLSSAFSDSNTLFEIIVFEASVFAGNNTGHPCTVPLTYTPSGNFLVTLIDFITLLSVLRHKAGQEGRGEILLENSFM